MFTLQKAIRPLLLSSWVLAVASPLALAEENPQAAPPLTELKTRTIQSDVPLTTQAREAATRAIPYIEKEGTAWVNDRKCLSCHFAGYMIWSFRNARERGFDIDQDKLAEWTNWSLSQQKNHGAEGAAQSLLARDRSDSGEATTKLIESQRDFILSKQESDGSWKPGGQLPSQKRPLSETTQVSTMLCVLGLASLDQPNEKTTASINQAVEWIKKTPPNGENPAVSGEWYTMRLLVEKKFGEQQEVETLREKILAAQQSDGGWGWLWTDKSDAFGTGLALYALAEAGVTNSHPAIERSWKLLIETQTDAGSWIVNGTKTSTKDSPHPMSSFWGSTWALQGLIRSLLSAP